MYVAGVASSIDDLLDALTTALTAAGWSNTGNVWYKSGCYVSLGKTGNRLVLDGGTGQSAGTLTGQGPIGLNSLGTKVYLNVFGSNGIQYPASYYIHLFDSPVEVYMLVNDSGTRWSRLAFGKSPSAGISTGNWHAGTSGRNVDYIDNYYSGCSLHPQGRGAFNLSGFMIEGFTNWDVYNFDGAYSNAFFHHGLDSATWSRSGFEANPDSNIAAATNLCDYPSQIYCMTPNYPLWKAQPNTLNGQAMLIRINLYIKRASGKMSMVGQLNHSRHIRNTYYNDGDIVNLGGDRWKVYPMTVKNTSYPDGNDDSTYGHSGTLAIAVRYDGP